jgi:hypothetical protein
LGFRWVLLGHPLQKGGYSVRTHVLDSSPCRWLMADQQGT